MVSHQAVGCWIRIAQMKLEVCQKPTRAVHIELIEAMSTDSFINTLRRFFSIWGPAKLLRSNRGGNFVGTCRELDMATNDSAVTKHLQEKGWSWAFNRAHASHMGGSWERLIGVARRILDAMLLQKGPICLTHEIFSTFNDGGDGNHQCKTHCVHIHRPGDAPGSLPKRLVLSCLLSVFRLLYSFAVWEAEETSPVSCGHLLEAVERRVSLNSAELQEMDQGQAKCEGRRCGLTERQPGTQEWMAYQTGCESFANQWQ